jgi:leucyl aminopeptidase
MFCAGSKFPPQFIHLKYSPEGTDDRKDMSDIVRIALIGKGLTFDSGGYNLKVGAGSQIEMMKYDMGGCAAVLGSAIAIAQLKPKNVEVHWISAVCENMVSADAVRPGDILKASNGKTIEVLNTDAEGRLTLSDAIVYAEKQGVDVIIDLATLTGAVVVGIREKLAALYADDDNLRDELERAACRSHEQVWRMPLVDSYRPQIKSTIAELKNIGGWRILQEFVDKAMGTCRYSWFCLGLSCS